MYAVLLLVSITAISVTGYRLLGGPSVWSWQAVYMAVITLSWASAMGKSSIPPPAPALRVFNIFVVLFGVTIMVYVFSVVTAFLVESEIRNIFWRRKMQKRISELRDHYIICGLGDTGRYAVEELEITGSPYVVIESNEEMPAKLREQDAFKSMLYVVGTRPRRTYWTGPGWRGRAASLWRWRATRTTS